MSRQLNLLKLCITLSMLLPFCSSGAASSQQNPYKVIYDRNLFGLRPPTPVHKPEPLPALPPNIILTGITTILGEKRAFLEITPPPKPSTPAKSQSFNLTEGQKAENVQVVEIDPKAETVKVSISDNLTTLTFEKNGRKPTQVPAPLPVLNRTLPVRRIPSFSLRR